MKPKADPPAARPAPAPAPRPRTAPAQRLPRHERREQILAKAYLHFSEHGLNAQTRALAESCGVSQRLLYSFFPSKAALIDEVYRTEIAGSFKAIWFVELQDRTVPIEARLQRFYTDYFQTVTTRRWLRLFLHASLADVAMAPAYIATIVTHMLGIVVAEAAHERGLRAPSDAARVQEIGWVLHGAISHLAIRRHVYGNANPMPADEVIALQVRVFLAGLDAVLPAAPRRR
jgi:AcrR family transcriptional regulator